MKISTEERFWSKVQSTAPDECWLWTASVDRGGYGKFRHSTDSGWVRAHRWAYEHLVGPIPNGLVIDHLCRVRNCVNPDHLEPVTNRENTLRGLNPIGQPRKTHCKHGHEFTPDNIYTKPGTSWRECRTCKRALKRAHEARQRLAKTLERNTPP